MSSTLYIPLLMMYTHALDPIALDLGFLQVRWYGIMYLLGLAVAWGWLPRVARTVGLPFTREQLADLLFYTFLWGVIGGRVGEFLFYQTDVLLQNPLEVLYIWHGGMSIHGGLLGSVGYIAWWTRRHGVGFLRIADLLAMLLTVGLALGRVANFINGELVGLPTDGTWGVIFPAWGDMPRYPTQLYEALKNLLLLLVLSVGFSRYGWWRRPGVMSGVFLLGYGVMRFCIEFWKEQDAVYAGLGTGQWLCILMMILGIFLLIRSRRATLPA